MQPYFGQENIQFHYVDTDGAVKSMKTKDYIKDLKNLEDLFDFSNFNENHELVSIKNEKVRTKFELETPKNIWIDELAALQSKMYAFKHGVDSKNDKKGII